MSHKKTLEENTPNQNTQQPTEDIIKQIEKRIATLENNPNPPSKSVEVELLDLKNQLIQLQDFAIQTRLVSTFSAQSLPMVIKQFQRVVADSLAIRNSLLDVEEQLVDESASVDELMRERSRLSENIKSTDTYLDRTLRNYRAISEENIALSGKANALKKESEAKNQVIQQAEELLKAIRKISTEKNAPEDIVASLNELFNELPKPLPQNGTELNVPEGADSQIDEGAGYT